jgi:IS30 family transposase
MSTSRPGFTVTGSLAHGKLTFDAPDRYRDLVRRLSRAVTRVTVTIEKEVKRRSNKQNAWLWGCAYEVMLADSGYEQNELKQAKEDLHYSLVAKCFGAHYDERLKTDVPNARSSRLSTEEFSHYMEWLQRHAAQEWHVVIPDPNEEWMFNQDAHAA